METLDLEAALAGRAPGYPDLPDPVSGDSALAARAPTDVTQAGPETGYARRVAEARLATPVLVDCLSTWLAGVMEECGLWDGAPDADKQLAERVDGLLDAWRATRRHVVAVSNEVGSGVIPGTVSGVRFRDELGVLNARIAAECEQVWLCVAGIAQRLR